MNIIYTVSKTKRTVITVMSIGERLKQLRITNGLTQEQVAKHIGSTKSCVSMYESGKRIPGRNTLPVLAQLFSVTVDYIISTPSLALNETSSEYKVLPEIPTYESIDDLIAENNSYATANGLLACVAQKDCYYISYPTELGNMWLLIGEYSDNMQCKVAIVKDKKIALIDSCDIEKFKDNKILGRAYNMTYIL